MKTFEQNQTRGKYLNATRKKVARRLNGLFVPLGWNEVKIKEVALWTKTKFNEFLVILVSAIYGLSLFPHAHWLLTKHLEIISKDGNLTPQNAWGKSSSCSAILTLWLPLYLLLILKDVSTERDEKKKANVSTIPLCTITEYPFNGIKNYRFLLFVPSRFASR